MASSFDARRQVGAQIRTMHRYGFRAGEWAKIYGYSEDADGLYWLVKFDDGATDWWRVDDQAAQYEIRHV